MLIERAVCFEQTARDFLPYLSHKIFRKGFTHASIPHLAGVMATVFLNQDETVDSYKVYNSQKALGRKGNRLFDMHGFDHTEQQNDSRFGTWLMPCPVFCCLPFAEDRKISCSWRIRVYSVLNMLENKIGRKKEETEEETEPCNWPGCIATTIPFVV